MWGLREHNHPSYNGERAPSEDRINKKKLNNDKRFAKGHPLEGWSMSSFIPFSSWAGEDAQGYYANCLQERDLLDRLGLNMLCDKTRGMKLVDEDDQVMMKKSRKKEGKKKKYVMMEEEEEDVNKPFLLHLVPCNNNNY